MSDCDGFFEARNIPYDPDFADLAVYTAHHDSGKDQGEAKRLIMCWYDVTYGQWNDLSFDNTKARAAMSTWLAGTKYASFEALLNDRPPETKNYGKRDT